MLHLLHIPLTGLLVGSSAVIFISLIAHYSNNKSSILKATLLVLIIKFIVAPFTPLPAYFSLFMEGLLGLFFYNILNLKRSASVLLGFSILLFFSIQRIFTYTILFGITLWESLDLFADFIFKQFALTSNLKISFSYSLISAYVLIHIIVGIIAGIVANKIPNWVENFSYNIEFEKIKIEKGNNNLWYKKKTRITFIILTLLLILLSYTTIVLDSNLLLNITIMIIRSIIIMLLWYFFIAPYAEIFVKNILNKKRIKYSTEVENIFNLLPEIGALVKYSWEEATKKRGVGRIKLFISYIFVIILRED
jgi:hypothetical protein